MTRSFPVWALAAVPAATLALAMVPAAALAQSSDDAYIVKVSAAAPASVAKDATIVQASPDGTMHTVRAGTNGFTCMMAGPKDAMCADKNAMAWIHAIVTHSAPPDVVGVAYMLAGDEGESNTDPMAPSQTASNHWLVTGPHLMLFGPAVKTMGYPMTPDPDPTSPYVMWAGTQYAHLMIPVTASP